MNTSTGLSFTVYGAFAPTPTTFDNEADAIAYADRSTNDWAPDVYVVRSEVIYRASRQGPHS